MNRKSDEIVNSKSETAADAQPKPATLRLVHSGKRPTKITGSAEAPRQLQKKPGLGPRRDSNDDDPGPTAA